MQIKMCAVDHPKPFSKRKFFRAASGTLFVCVRYFIEALFVAHAQKT